MRSYLMPSRFCGDYAMETNLRDLTEAYTLWRDLPNNDVEGKKHSMCIITIGGINVEVYGVYEVDTLKREAQNSNLLVNTDTVYVLCFDDQKGIRRYLCEIPRWMQSLNHPYTCPYERSALYIPNDWSHIAGAVGKFFHGTVTGIKRIVG